MEHAPCDSRTFCLVVGPHDVNGRKNVIYLRHCCMVHTECPNSCSLFHPCMHHNTPFAQTTEHRVAMVNASSLFNAAFVHRCLILECMEGVQIHFCSAQVSLGRGSLMSVSEVTSCSPPWCSGRNCPVHSLQHSFDLHLSPSSFHSVLWTETLL